MHINMKALIGDAMKNVAGALLLFFVFFALARAVFSVEEFRSNADESEAYNVTRVQKVVDGHVFWVEEDRPIEKVAGLYRPMDMDSYIQLKFSKLQKQLDDLANKTKARIDKLEGQVGNLTQKVDRWEKKQDAWLKNAQNISNTTTP
ncbi:hypothetical protein BU251_02185 [Candidatus Velamenicoccus archaeovorus]|uniref:Uncharacterized protein n=2 Tax=Velamenicoccus archaeovorus TaxID=1930593 RepID=A0A410P3B0_VELA1|nr:hypothetical protein BU251_02185 [Candidatus Velamenicoccus archaeovorus]